MSQSQVWESRFCQEGLPHLPEEKAEAQEQGTGLLGPTAHTPKQDCSLRQQDPRGLLSDPLRARVEGGGGREGWEAEPRAFLLRKPTLALKVLTTCRKARAPRVVGEEARVRCVTLPVCASVSPVQTKEGHLIIVLL